VSLRAFHLFFVAASIVLTAFLAVWAGREFQASHHASYAVGSAAAVVGGAGLAFHG